MGLVIFVFVFGLTPGEPPVSVMLTILAVIGCASVLQSAGGLDVMMQFAEKILRKHPKYITILAPLTTWTLTVLCGTGHVVYTMFPIIDDIAIKNNIRPERPMAASSVASQMGITASPVFVNGRLYFFDDSGNTLVRETGAKGKVLARNTMLLGPPDQNGHLISTNSSPVFDESRIYWRAGNRLYCIGDK